MSWVNLGPSDIISTLNILSAAYTERYNYFFAKSEQPETLPRPSSPFAVRNFMSYLNDGIFLLYKNHCPVRILGSWGHWQPYHYDGSREKVGAAISEDLTAAGIDPGGILLTRPRRIADRTFVLGAYYLLNNILLYRVHNLGGKLCTSHEEEWWSEGNYDSNTPYLDEIKEDTPGGGYAMRGYYKSSRLRMYNHRFYQPPIGDVGEHYPLLRGNWKGRYTTKINKVLSKPRKSGLEEYGVLYDIPGVKEVNFSGRESTIIPYLDDITSDIAYYRTWGNYQYGYALSYQQDTLTEAYLTSENFPNPNYQYLD